MSEVVWNALAKVDYHNNIDYLLKYWPVKVAQEFIDDVEKAIYNLKTGTIEYQETEYKEVKKCVLCKQITMYYKHTGENKVELLRFWNNYQDSKKLQL